MEISPSAIAETRKHLGMSQAQLAAFLRVGRNTVARWEMGKHRPTAHLVWALREMADYVGVDLETTYAPDAS